MFCIYHVNDIKSYFSGEKLYGDDFPQHEIDKWFEDEKEGYSNLIRVNRNERLYGYHALNMRHGFSKLPVTHYGRVLGVGSAYGDELIPFLTPENCEEVTILEPSKAFHVEVINSVPVRYVSPNSTGVMPFVTDTFGLIVCLGVLHHIPNVSTIIREFYRVLQPGGYALIREPIGSMGDWRKPRRGLTKRERGIPLGIFQHMIKQTGFTIINETKCMFSLTSRLHYILVRPVYNNSLIVALDQIICALPIWSRTYHAENLWQKLRPTAAFFVLQKCI